MYERLVELAGGGDLAARMLALYDPPPYLSGCSQGVLRQSSPVLVRNYDYAPDRLEGVILHTKMDEASRDRYERLPVGFARWDE